MQGSLCPNTHCHDLTRTGSAPCACRYDLPPDYNTRTLQHVRVAHDTRCAWRGFDERGNRTVLRPNAHYHLETYLHEQLLISPHRCVALKGAGTRTA